jgi:hypothetical protein
MKLSKSCQAASSMASLLPFYFAIKLPLTASYIATLWSSDASITTNLLPSGVYASA